MIYQNNERGAGIHAVIDIYDPHLRSVVGSFCFSNWHHMSSVVERESTNDSLLMFYMDRKYFMLYQAA